MTQIPKLLAITISSIMIFSILATTLPVFSATMQQRGDFSDTPTTVRYGNSKICGDHLCAPGEHQKLIDALNSAQKAKGGNKTITEPPVQSIPVQNIPAQNMTAQMPPQNMSQNQNMPQTSTQPTSSCPPVSSMSTGNTTMISIYQSANTTDYNLKFEIGPPANMLMMCQVTSSTTSGNVIVAGQMNSMSTTGNAYHLELHALLLKTGATVVVPLDTVSITVTSSSGTKTSVPIAEMFDVSQGPTDLHYGNNVQLKSGNYTVGVSVGSESASFNVKIK